MTGKPRPTQRYMNLLAENTELHRICEAQRAENTQLHLIIAEALSCLDSEGHYLARIQRCKEVLSQVD